MEQGAKRAYKKKILNIATIYNNKKLYSELYIKA